MASQNHVSTDVRCIKSTAMFSIVKNDTLLGSKKGGLSDTVSDLPGATAISDVISDASQIRSDHSQSLPVENTIDLSAVPVASLSEVLPTGGLAAKLAKQSDYLDRVTAKGEDALLAGGPMIQAAAARSLKSSLPLDAFVAYDQTSLNSAVGTFVVDDGGQVDVDFLFDGGGYAGELAVFSLAGMGGLSKEAFIKEAAARSLSNSSQGRVVIADTTEGAQFSGKLGGSDYNKGPAASTRVLNLAAGSRFALMLAPKGKIADALASDQQPLFSIAAFNPNGGTQIGQAVKGIYGMEDLPIGKGDADFNDIVFQIKGATSNVTNLDQVVNPAKDWRDSPVAQPFLKSPQFSEPGKELPPKSPTPEPATGKPSVDKNPATPPSDKAPPMAEKPPVVEKPPVAEKPIKSPALPSSSSKFISDISGAVNKFTPRTSTADLIASNADRIKIGTQTIYIGTEQVTSINQNPIIRSIDPANPSNNWLRTDIETTGTDGRGLGLAWTGSALYGVFSVDGTQGTPSQDFRRASGGAQQNWLKSFGPGGGKKVAVIGQLDPATGKLLKAAHLSAVLSNGQSNSLSVKGMTTNSAGNLVISASSYSSPRKPDGKALTRNPGNKAGSPFDYTLEITPDLSRVVSTSAKGWS